MSVCPLNPLIFWVRELVVRPFGVRYSSEHSLQNNFHLYKCCGFATTFAHPLSRCENLFEVFAATDGLLYV